MRWTSLKSKDCNFLKNHKFQMFLNFKRIEALTFVFVLSSDYLVYLGVGAEGSAA